MSVFLDTNILVYCYDRLSGDKHDVAVDLLDRLVTKEEITISTQIINEFIVVMSSKVKHPLDLDVIGSHVKEFDQVFDVRPVQMADCLRALSIVKRYHMSYWDSLVIATALNSGCSILYSEDMQHGQIIGRKLQIMNPFLQ